MNKFSISGISLAVLLALATLSSVTLMQNAKAQTTPDPCIALLASYATQQKFVAANQAAVNAAQSKLNAAINKLITDSSGLNALKPGFGATISADTAAIVAAANAITPLQAKLTTDTNALNALKTQLTAVTVLYQHKQQKLINLIQ